MTNIEMNTEKKFLDPNYVATRLRDFKDIQKRVVTFSIHKSDNETSNSIYVDFWVGHFKCSTLRISDHIIEYPQSQFIVGEDILTKKKKAQFITNPAHSILCAAHPSPLSAYNGFFGCRHFSKASQLFNGGIEWKLP